MFGLHRLSDYAWSEMSLAAWKAVRKHGYETPQHQADAIGYASKCGGWSYPKDPEWL